MKKLRWVAVVSTVALATLGAVVAPATAKKACPKFKPVEPQSESSERAEALEAPVIKVTEKATEAKPLLVEYEHGPGMWPTSQLPAIHEDTSFFNFQVESKRAVALNMRAEWATPSPSDIDLYLYDASGNLIASGTAYNPVPALGSGTGAEGWEGLDSPAYAERCDGFTLESRAASSAGESMTLKVWLTKV